MNKTKGCELCGDFPVYLSGRCHPTAPLRIELYEDNILVCYCYLPECNREVARFKIAEFIPFKELKYMGISNEK